MRNSMLRLHVRSMTLYTREGRSDDKAESTKARTLGKVYLLYSAGYRWLKTINNKPYNIVYYYIQNDCAVLT